jgi:hypothetical protein
MSYSVEEKFLHDKYILDIAKQSKLKVVLVKVH